MAGASQTIQDRDLTAVSRDKTGRKEANGEAGESRKQKHTLGEVEFYLFFRFGLNLFQNERVYHSLCETDVTPSKTELWENMFSQSISNFISRQIFQFSIMKEKVSLTLERAA